MTSVASANVPAFRENAYCKHLLRELRSDHAGETGAVYIYKGVLAVTGDSEMRAFAEEHLQTELQHLAFFEDWLPACHQSNLIGIWRIAGFALGAIAGLMGQRMLGVTINAVETFVVQHDQQQLDYLNAEGNADEKMLAPILVHFQADEAKHRDDAAARMSKLGLLSRAWQKLVGVGSAAAVTVARRV